MADKQEVIDALHRECAGRARCSITSGDMDRHLVGRLQLDPMKPALKAPESNRLKLEHEKTL